MITTRTQLCNGFESPLGLSRRKALQSFGMGLGSLALAALLAAEARAQSPQTAAPPAKASRTRVALTSSTGPVPRISNAATSGALPTSVFATRSAVASSAPETGTPIDCQP